MSEVIPKGWLVRVLDRDVEILSGYPFQSSLFTDDSREIGLIRIRDLNEQHVATFYKGDFDEVYIVRQGDVLIGMDGDFNIVKWKAKRALLNQRICKIKASKNSGFCTDFLFHSLIVDLQEIHSETGATTVKHLSVKDIRSIEKAYPPLPEQQKIAAILSSVDDVIEKTRAQIDKLKDLKTAMMQELLTQGIGHTEFKDSPVGRIPRGWDVRLLDEVARRGSGHTPSKSQGDYWNGSIQWVSLSDSNKLDQLYITDTSKKISQLGIENSSAVIHPSGTVIMSRDAGIGKSAILASDMAVSQHFMAWVCSPKLNNYFLYYLLQNWKQKFEAIAMGSTIKTIGLSFFKSLEIPLPSIQEQQKIVNVLKSLDIWMFYLENKKTTLEATKKSLMQDLLTGKVRVKLDQPETTAA